MKIVTELSVMYMGKLIVIRVVDENDIKIKKTMTQSILPGVARL